jgi:hypothetical protein
MAVEYARSYLTNVGGLDEGLLSAIFEALKIYTATALSVTEKVSLGCCYLSMNRFIFIVNCGSNDGLSHRDCHMFRSSQV